MSTICSLDTSSDVTSRKCSLSVITEKMSEISDEVRLDETELLDLAVTSCAGSSGGGGGGGPVKIFPKRMVTHRLTDQYSSSLRNNL